MTKEEYNTKCKELYDMHFGHFERLSEIAKEKIEDLLNDFGEGYDYNFVNSRTKGWDRFLEKCIKKKYTIEELPHGITDFSGIRIVVPYKDYFRAVEHRICEVVDIIEREDKSQILQYNEFDYLSLHLIAQFNKKFLSENRSYYCFKDYKFEIQIRTLLQHAWASRSHVLQYTQGQNISPTCKRRLSRLAAIFEFIDDEIVNIRDSLSQEAACGTQTSSDQPCSTIDQISVPESVANSENRTELNKSSLYLYFSSDGSLSFLQEYASSQNFIIIKALRADFLSSLSMYCTRIGILNIEDLDTYFNNKKNIYKRVFKIWKGKWNRNAYNLDALIIMLLLIVEHKKFDLRAETADWKETFANIVIESVAELK